MLMRTNISYIPSVQPVEFRAEDSAKVCGNALKVNGFAEAVFSQSFCQTKLPCGLHKIAVEQWASEETNKDWLADLVDRHPWLQESDATAIEYRICRAVMVEGCDTSEIYGRIEGELGTMESNFLSILSMPLLGEDGAEDHKIRSIMVRMVYAMDPVCLNALGKYLDWSAAAAVDDEFKIKDLSLKSLLIDQAWRRLCIQQGVAEEDEPSTGDWSWRARYLEAYGKRWKGVKRNERNGLALDHLVLMIEGQKKGFTF